MCLLISSLCTLNFRTLWVIKLIVGAGWFKQLNNRLLFLSPHKNMRFFKYRVFIFQLLSISFQNSSFWAQISSFWSQKSSIWNQLSSFWRGHVCHRSAVYRYFKFYRGLCFAHPRLSTTAAPRLFLKILQGLACQAPHCILFAGRHKVVPYRKTIVRYVETP